MNEYYTPYLRYLGDDLLKEYKLIWPMDESYIIGNKDYEGISDFVKTGLTRVLKKLPLKQRARIGLTVSPSSIERIVQKTYKIAFRKDGSINTESEKILNRLSILLGSKNWYDYIARKQKENDVVSDLESRLITLVRNAARTRLERLESFTLKEESIGAFGKRYDRNRYLQKRSQADFIEHLEYHQLEEKDIKLKFKDIAIFVDSPEIVTSNYAIVKAVENYEVYKGKKQLSEHSNFMRFDYLYILRREGKEWQIAEKYLSHKYYSSVFSHPQLQNIYRSELYKQDDQLSFE